jgi:hypothetical protein
MRDTGYAKIKEKKLLDGARIAQPDRYEAVNLTNQRTIEFRIFRGTLRYESIMACIEFTRAVWHFTRVAAFHELTTQCFIDWTTRPENRKETKHLRQILFEKHLLQSKTPPLREMTCALEGEQ